MREGPKRALFCSLREKREKSLMEETIAAVSTPAGAGGIGIVRVSGETARQVMEKIFRPASGSFAPDRTMMYGHIVDPQTGAVQDEVLSVFLPGPATYTTEDTFEIDCHGGSVPLKRTLQAALNAGARPAERGEFTKRAFLGGRIDLSQAEAVMDLVSAKTDRMFEVAMDQLEGSLSEEVRKLRADLTDILVDLTVNIDYPDEDIEILTYEKLEKALGSVRENLSVLLEGAKQGRILKEGLRTAIVGKPNAGKSSLMNRLLGESRAIVTDVPGTTRDTIEETISIRGIPLVLTDTAGIRDTEDPVEKIGVERSKASFNEADVVLFVADASRPLEPEDDLLLPRLDPARTVAVLNKTDLPTVLTKEALQARAPGVTVVECSMKDGTGLNALEDAILEMAACGSDPDSRVTVTNARHQALLKRAEQDLSKALEAADGREPFEIVALGAEDAYEALGELLGENCGNDILEEVFSRFCLGK